MKHHPDVKFHITNKSTAPKLLRLIDWLEAQRVRHAADLEKLPTEQPKSDALGRVVATELTRARDAIRHRLDQCDQDIAAARVWLLECETNQEWQIGMELAHWLNRPALAESAKG